MINKADGDSATGNYNIFLERTNDPANSVNIDFDQTMTGTITSVAQSNAYTFSGSVDDTLNFTVVAASGNLWPCIQIYNSAGAPVAKGSSCPGGGTATLNGFVVSVQLTRISVLLKAYGDWRRLGNYNMSVPMHRHMYLLPAPTLTSISPTSVLAGSGGLTLTVTGT